MKKKIINPDDIPLPRPKDLEIKKERKRMGSFEKIWKKMMDSQTTYWPTGDLIGYFMLLVSFGIGVFKISNGTMELNSVISLIFFVEYIMWPARQRYTSLLAVILPVRVMSAVR